MDQEILLDRLLRVEALDEITTQALCALRDETLAEIICSLPSDKLLLVARALPDDKLAVLMSNDDIGEVAFEALHFRYRAVTRDHIKRRIEDPIAVEDVVQECWLSIWKSRKLFRPGAKFTTLMWFIVGRRIIDWLRRYYRQRDYVIYLNDYEQLLEDLADEQADTEFRVAFKDALSHLPQKYRIVLEMRCGYEDEQGLSYKEISIRLKMSVAFVKININRAVALLNIPVPEKRRRPSHHGNQPEDKDISVDSYHDEGGDK